MAFQTRTAPGYSTIQETGEWQGLLNARGREMLLIDKNVTISSAATDAGNTPTTTLRAGSVMAKLDSGGEYVLYDSDATTGAQIARGVLLEQLNMLDYAGTAEDKPMALIAIRGNFRASELHNLDAAARQQLLQLGCVFDDPAGSQALQNHLGVIEKAADYTVVAADNGALFVATAAANFTLPTKAHGLCFQFLQTADANMAILSAGSADDIIVKGDAGADSVTFSTASNKIGAWAEVRCIYVGGALKWIVKNLGDTTMTIA